MVDPRCRGGILTTPTRGANAWTAIARGIRKTCPHCGRGALLAGWIAIADCCPACGLIYQRNRGDIWAYIVIADRIPIALAIVAIFFGFRSETWLMMLVSLLALAVPLVITMPHRVGVAVALDYWTRVRWPDANDPIPTLDDPAADRS